MSKQSIQNRHMKNNEYSEEHMKELIWELPKALLVWYDFKSGSRILYIGKFDAYAEFLEEQALQIIYADCEQLKDTKWQEKFKAYFDYAVCIEMLETCQNPQDCLTVLRSSLGCDGILLLGMNNRLGLRYFCGDRDPYTSFNFDGIENYRRIDAQKEVSFCGRMYSREELRRMLFNAGWKSEYIQFYSVLSDLHNPAFISAEDYIFNEDLAHRVSPTYNYPGTVFLEEEPLYQSLIENNMFHQMANAYLIECSMKGNLSDVSHVTSSMGRGRQDALLTVIYKSGIVEKRAAYPEGYERLEEIVEHGEDLKAHGVAVVEARLINGVCQMPYVNAETGQLYLKKLLQTDKEMFLAKLDRFRDLIMQSSEVVQADKGDGGGAILRKVYLDMVPLNSFYINDQFVFFDQEFCENDYPVNVLLYRMIATMYGSDMEIRKMISAEELYERYGIKRHIDRWSKMAGDFIGKLLKKEKLSIYNEKYKKNLKAINANRYRMNLGLGEANACRPPVIVQRNDHAATSKKYHIGYVAGVFDMFHLGHVNLLRRAKEQCDYLIVGVLSDEEVFRQKKKYPIIPCEDRVEVLRSCRYADQVEVLQLNHATIREAYQMFRFDCMFSGDDHKNAIGWIRAKEYLRENGADIVFFNYTEKVSSTKLRESLEDKKLMDEGL